MELDLSNSSLTESELIHLAMKQNQLTEVSLSAARGLSDTSCSSWLQNCHKLVYLDLSFCSNITDRSFEGLHDPHLKTLNLKGCEKLTNQALVAIASGCKNLKGLYLAYCACISDQGLFPFKNTSLRNLDLSRCPQVTDEGIFHMVKESSQLIFLNLIDTKVSDPCKKEILSLNPQLSIIF